MKRRRGLSDTSPEAERVLAQVFREMPSSRKWLLIAEDYRLSRLIHAAGTRSRDPLASSEVIRRRWLTDTLGEGPWLDANGDSGVEQSNEILTVVHEVVAIFERLNIRYALGGSLASSFHGVNRATRDADFAVEPFPGREDEFIASLSSNYYVSRNLVVEANQLYSSFNVIQTFIGSKVDLFIQKDRRFDRALLDRRIWKPWPEAPDRPIALVSAEDVILLKLERYRLGGEISERQWLDVLNVLKVQSGRLDFDYLKEMALELRVADLLSEAESNAAADLA